MAQVSTQRVVKNDYAAFLLAITGPIVFLIGLGSGVLGFMPTARGRGGFDIEPQQSIMICGSAIFITIVLMFLLGRRVQKISRILSTGQSVTATIADIRFVKDRGRIEFEYIHEGTTYRTGTAIMKNRHTKSFEIGSKIQVVVDPADSSKALICDLY